MGGPRGAAGLRLLLLLAATDATRGDAPQGRAELRCLRLGPAGGMNCSWGGPAPPPGPLVLHYRSLKLRQQVPGTARAPPGQRWVLVPRAELTAGDVYAVWVQAPGGQRVTQPLNVSLDLIEKPPAPQLQVEATPVLGLRWMWPPGWAGAGGAPRCALRYRPRGQRRWRTVPESELEPGGYEFPRGQLAPGAPHEAQGRCAPPEPPAPWSDWSPSAVFTTALAALPEVPRVWCLVEASRQGEPRPVLRWQEPAGAGGHVRGYMVTAEPGGGRGPPRRLRPPCCRLPLPPGTARAALRAHRRGGTSAPARLRLRRCCCLPRPGEEPTWGGRRPGDPPELGTSGHRHLGPGQSLQLLDASRSSILISILGTAVLLTALAVAVAGLRARRCHQVLPPWCWEPVPDPRRSRAACTQDPPKPVGPPEPPEPPVSRVSVASPRPPRCRPADTGPDPDGRADPDTHPDSDTDPELDTHPDSDRDPDTHLHTGADPHVDTDTGALPVGSGYERHFLPTPEEVLGLL